MEQNEQFRKNLIKCDPEATEYFIDCLCDKAYSYSLYFFGDRFTAEEAVKQSFAVFFAGASSLLDDNTPVAAYFAVLKDWCDKKYTEIKKKNDGVYPYDLSVFEDKKDISFEMVKILSELNKKQRALILLADVVGLKRSVLCEIYDVEPDGMATALSVCRDTLKKRLSDVGDFTVKGGEAE